MPKSSLMSANMPRKVQYLKRWIPRRPVRFTSTASTSRVTLLSGAGVEAMCAALHKVGEVEPNQPEVRQERQSLFCQAYAQCKTGEGATPDSAWVSTQLFFVPLWPGREGDSEKRWVRKWLALDGKWARNTSICQAAWRESASLNIMAKFGGKGVNLKDKLEGNELDLSLCDLNEVPVKELAGLPKATVLDLSCNNLTSLPSDFCSLTHLVKLDLSKNQLQQLPLDFGRLVNLQHLDLLNNRLVTLPVSFAQLKNLKWLDLKDNPLDPSLAKVAGDCLDEKQCKQAAVRVLQYMKSIQSELDRERQRKLQAERELEKKREAEQRAREAQERELRKREKAEEKERRRREYDALRAAKLELDKHRKKENGENPIRNTAIKIVSSPPTPMLEDKNVILLSLLNVSEIRMECLILSFPFIKATSEQTFLVWNPAEDVAAPAVNCPQYFGYL
ncbi:UNVERIFIED_CONTAM: hypothetical protein K2H54_016999 [Gekko kuhli]